MSRKKQTAYWISLAAIFISILSLAAAIVIPLIGFRLAYSEKIVFELLDEDLDYVHALSLHNEKAGTPSVTKIAIWKKIRVANNSGKAVSVVSVFYREDEAITHDPLLPFFSKVLYEIDSVLFEDPMELPIYLEPGQVVMFYALIPVSIPDDLGHALYELLKREKPRRNALIWFPFTIGEAFFDMLGMEDALFVENLMKKQGAKIDRLTYQTIDITRSLFSKPDEEYRFMDQTNHAIDGLKYERGARLFSGICDYLRRCDPPIWTMPDSSFQLYNIYLQTNNGNVYHRWISSSSLPFRNYLMQP